MFDPGSVQSVGCGSICEHAADESPTHSLKPTAIAAEGAGYYLRVLGWPVPALDFSAIVACPERGQFIANHYLRAPRIEAAAVPAYRAFRAETERQYVYLTSPIRYGGLGVRVELADTDPYPDASAMVRDLVENRRLKVFATAACHNPHPLLTDAENDRFRAVHDVFGHASIGRGFDRHGEDAAWVRHASMYSPLARRAMTTETRGTNSAQIWGAGGSPFPPQKAILLPAGVCRLSSFSVRPCLPTHE